MQTENLTGRQSGRWTVIGDAPSIVGKHGHKVGAKRCRCQCGTIRDVRTQSLVDGTSLSCGCYHRDKQKIVGKKTKHGMSDTRLYHIYHHMRNRCYNKNDIDYPNYGGRGISICNEWSTFESFAEWALKSGYSDSLSIDRIDVNQGYCPDNCRWADVDTQSNNKRNTRYYTFDGQTKSIGEWAKIYGIPYQKLWRRFDRGWSVEKALTYDMSSKHTRSNSL